MRKKEQSPSLTGLSELHSPPASLPIPVITRLQFWEHWLTVGHMYRNYRGVDPVFERLMGGKKLEWFSRWLRGPLYYWLLNTGYGLRVGRKLAGQLYLQFRPSLTHINDLEINHSFRQKGYSYKLLALAERQARLRKHRYLTLGVTLSNTRAVNLYLKAGFLEQHHRLYFLSRPSWSEPPLSTPLILKHKMELQLLTSRQAKANLKNFFAREQRASEPLTAPVWEAHYRPSPPSNNRGVSFAVYFEGYEGPQGHVDFFDWQTRGRWRIYLEEAHWGAETEESLLRYLLHQSQGYTNQWFNFGSAQHHAAVRPLVLKMGMSERDGERMLMIKPL